MDSILVKDRYFKPFIPAAEIAQRVAEVAAEISADFEGRNPLLLAVLNGSFVFAADLARQLTIPFTISFIRLSSYEGMESTGELKEVIGLSENIGGRPLIIVEDIIDSGLTMASLLESLRRRNPTEIRVCTLLTKPGNLKADVRIDYSAFSIPNDFIVGYGLDYDGFGRGLKEIYLVDTKASAQTRTEKKKTNHIIHEKHHHLRRSGLW